LLYEPMDGGIYVLRVLDGRRQWPPRRSVDDEWISPMSDAYTDLLVRFAPSSITSEDEAGMVQRQIDELVDRGVLSPDERKLLSLLGDLVLAWEGDRYDLPAASPADTIRALLDARGMRQGDLVGRVFPTKGIASEVLNGKRPLTYEHVARLAEVFHVSPAIFYGAAPLWSRAFMEPRLMKMVKIR